MPISPIIDKEGFAELEDVATHPLMWGHTTKSQEKMNATVDQRDWDYANYSLAISHTARHLIHPMVGIWHGQEWREPLNICEVFRNLMINVRWKEM